MSNNKKQDLKASLENLGIDFTKWPFTSTKLEKASEVRDESGYIPAKVVDTYYDGPQVDGHYNMHGDPWTQMVEQLQKAAESTKTNKAESVPSAAEVVQKASYNNYESMVQDWFTYHSPKADQPARYTNVRAGALAFANVVLANVPDGADRDAALQLLRQAVMMANAAIALE